MAEKIKIKDIADTIKSQIYDKTPFDLAVIRPSRLIKKRYMPYLSKYSHGWEDVKDYKSIAVIVLFTNVAADYFIRDELVPRLIKKINSQYRLPVCHYDGYNILRKEIAVIAGLGKVGRNSLFFSRKFGFNCKIDLILLDMECNEYSPSNNIGWKLEHCNNCNECVKACPFNVYDDFKLNKIESCDKHITPYIFEGKEKMCRKCITACPISNKILEDLNRKVGYEDAR